MKGILPFVLLAAASGAPPAHPTERPGVPDRPAPSRSIPTPKPVPVPVAPLASVPDATLRRRARKGDREAVSEMTRRGRLDGLGLHRGRVTEDAACRAGWGGFGGAPVFFQTYRQQRPVVGVPIVARWVWFVDKDRPGALFAGCLTVVPDVGAP